jgi:hypothetical protein
MMLIFGIAIATALFLLSMNRGILYIVWAGHDPRVEESLKRSTASAKEIHPELPQKVIRLDKGTLLDKASMFDLSPFDETLFLDADTMLLDRVDYGFVKAQQHGVACCICECPWARRYAPCSVDQIEYNTGVLFFNRSVKSFFDKWRELASTIDSSIPFRDGDNGSLIKEMPYNDQAGFSLAVEELKTNPFILPLNWNFRPAWHKSWFGEIKIWHDYNAVPDSFRSWNASQKSQGRLVDFAFSG